ncbi:MAG: hypothetical protein KAH57_04935 [Thermoplasmata archaeon]|nr:hypothetical protein [Thermoplasmata archaeon]
MEEVEKAKKEALKMLRSVQTLDDVKEHDQEIVDLMVGFITASVRTLENWFEEILSLEPEKKMEEIEKFQNTNYLSDEEINAEFERIDTIEGSGEHLEPFMGQFEERINPQIEKTGQMMEKLMADLGGAMGEAFGEMGEVSPLGEGTIKEPPVKVPWGDSFNSDDKVVWAKISDLSSMNTICTVGDLDFLKTFIPRTYAGIFSELVPELEGIKKSVSEDGSPLDEFQERLVQIEQIKLLTMEGFQAEMKRMSAIPKASEELARIGEESMTGAAPHIEGIEKLLKDIKSST